VAGAKQKLTVIAHLSIIHRGNIIGDWPYETNEAVVEEQIS
jgi:hypothetical protein